MRHFLTIDSILQTIRFIWLPKVLKLMSNQPKSRTKYLNIVKQISGIDFEITSASQEINEQQVLHRLQSDQVVILRDQGKSIAQRIHKREQLLEARQQYNLEQIFSLGLEFIKDDSLLERVDLDWMMKFIELAKNGFTPTLHELWAKVLAKELVKPGSFSHRSLKTLSELSTKEAKVFYQAVKLVCRFGEESSARLITGVYKKPTLMSFFASNNRVTVNLSKHGLNYTQLITLIELGLVHQQEIESAAYQTNDEIKITHQNQVYDVAVKQKDVVFTYYKLTQAGYELSQLIKPTGDHKLVLDILSDFSHLLGSNIEIYSKA